MMSNRNGSFMMVLALATATFLVQPAAAMAQPGNSGPAVYVDLGELGIDQTIQSADVPIASGGAVWFRFRLTTFISPLDSWLDVDTAGPSSISNNEVALYDAWGNRIGQDNDNGGGSTDWAAAMSFGGGSGQKLSGEAPGWGGGRISDGAWGANLAAGTYYVVIAGYDATFPDPNPNWGHTTSSTASGTVRLRLSTGVVPATTWNERHHGADGGSTPETAQIVEGSGPLETIITSFGASGRDMFKIRICDPTAFQVTATPTFGDSSGGGGTLRVRLFLFNEDGVGVAAINNTIAGTKTILVSPTLLSEGDYYLAVTSYCAGYFSPGVAPDGGPLDAFDHAMWDFSGNNNICIAPNGPGAANPIDYWARQQACSNIDVADEAYYTRLAMVGACHVQSNIPVCCPGDMDLSGIVNGDDVQEFVTALLSGAACP